MLGKIETWVLARVYEFPLWFRLVNLVAIGYGIHCVVKLVKGL